MPTPSTLQNLFISSTRFLNQKSCHSLSGFPSPDLLLQPPPPPRPASPPARPPLSAIHITHKLYVFPLYILFPCCTATLVPACCKYTSLYQRTAAQILLYLMPAAYVIPLFICLCFCVFPYILYMSNMCNQRRLSIYSPLVACYHSQVSTVMLHVIIYCFPILCKSRVQSILYTMLNKYSTSLYNVFLYSDKCRVQSTCIKTELNANVTVFLINR
jgi:hypothetical protein